jgi:hypothetical protein
LDQLGIKTAVTRVADILKHNAILQGASRITASSSNAQVDASPKRDETMTERILENIILIALAKGDSEPNRERMNIYEPFIETYTVHFQL